MYFLIVLKINDNCIIDWRTFGMSSVYGDLFRTAQWNETDIFEEGYYNYALITWVEEGLYPREIEQQWFAWMCGDEEQTPARACDKPLPFERTFIVG